jgi:chlorophyll synthase
MFLEDKTYEISPLKVLKYLFKHMAPLFWGVSIVPYYMAWILASRIFFPSPSDPIFVDFIVGLIAIGPMLGGATLVFNDYWDREIDISSKRKSNFPLPQLMVEPKTVLHASLFLMVIAVLLSLTVSLLFTLIILICLALSISYSAPPIRLKTKPGLDVITNAVGSGVLCSVAGWIVISPLIEYPIFWGILSFFGVSAIYIPTVLADYDSDKKHNVNTIAVKFGQKITFYLGLTSITIANIMIIAMGLSYYLFTPEMIYIIWPIALAQPFFYWWMLKEQDYRNVIKTLMSLTMLLTLGNVLLLLLYSGVIKI